MGRLPRGGEWLIDAEVRGADRVISSVRFFFQAEDGIRDDLVTGVQTCALPIYDPWWRDRRGVPDRRRRGLATSGRAQHLRRLGGGACRHSVLPRRTPRHADAERRSEERRVGKECRSRWWPDHYKKKKTSNVVTE